MTEPATRPEGQRFLPPGCWVVPGFFIGVWGVIALHGRYAGSLDVPFMLQAVLMGVGALCLGAAFVMGKGREGRKLLAALGAAALIVQGLLSILST